MGFEVDFLPVGDASRSGDAIALRYGNLYGRRVEQTVIVIDGGYTSTGDSLVEHITRLYGTDRVNIVVSTHPDQDHVEGLEVVLDQLEVGQLWMHLPWEHSGDLATLAAKGFRSDDLDDYLEKSLVGASNLQAKAEALGIPIRKPFVGQASDDGAFLVLGPTEEYYEDLLPDFPGTSTVTATILAKLKEAARSLVAEDFWTESLSEGGETSASNNSSAICLLQVDGRQLLFTADAGIPAIAQSLGRLEMSGFIPGTLNFVQVPHHGSKRNVSPSLLNRLLGDKGEQSNRGTAFVSAAAAGAPKHPAKSVVNAFRRRGYPVHATLGSTKRHSHDAPDRGWSPSVALPLYDQVEAEDD